MSEPWSLATPLAWNLVADAYVVDNLPHFEHYAEDALRLAKLREDARVLDVATGPGTLALLAAPRVAHVDALDFSPAMIGHLRRRLDELGVRNVDAREGDGQALPYADASFDAAFSMFGLMFFPDRARGFSEMKRVLAPGGRAVVSSWQPMTGTPVVSAVFGAIAEQFPGSPLPQEKGPLSDPADFRAELAAAGFHDVSVEGTTHTMQWPDFETLWAGLSRSFAPLVLMKAKLGDAVYAKVAAGVRSRLEAQLGPGAGGSPMPAWLGVGIA
jgi:ubiquinone/menaquinone biosynthesis C-methylase UbiE